MCFSWICLSKSDNLQRGCVRKLGVTTASAAAERISVPVNTSPACVVQIDNRERRVGLSVCALVVFFCGLCSFKESREKKQLPKRSVSSRALIPVPDNYYIVFWKGFVGSADS